MSTEILLLATIPVLAALVGYGTNVLALEMMFKPINYIGIPGTKNIRIFEMPIFGWQGIIPSKARVMAEMSVDLMTTKLLDVKEVFSRIKPAKVAQELDPVMQTLFPQMITAVAKEQSPTAWEMMPQSVKNEIIEKASRDAPVIISGMMEEIKNNIEKVFDIKHMVVSTLLKNPALINHIFLTVGKKEFQFIRFSGLVIGFILGLFQMLIWIFYQEPWVLIVTGFMGGYITNWVALKVVFEPVDPVEYFGFTFQGLFLKRQVEASAVYAEIVTKEILTSKNIVHSIITGPSSDNMIEIIHKHVSHAIDSYAGITKPIVALTIGGEQYSKIKEQLADMIVADLPGTLAHTTDYTDKALDMENTIREKMSGLSSLEFEQLLHPVFQQDEIKLILVGGVLAAGVGTFQAFVING